MLLERVPSLSAHNLALCVHAPDWRSCRVEYCIGNFNKHQTSCAVANAGDLVLSLPGLLACTRVFAEFPGSTEEQIINVARLAKTDARWNAQLQTSLRARMAVLAATPGGGLQQLWAAHAASGGIPPTQTACTCCLKPSCELRASYEHKPGQRTTASRCVWLCPSCNLSVHNNLLVLDWETTPMTWTFVSGPKSEAAKAAAESAAHAAALFELAVPEKCMVPGCFKMLSTSKRAGSVFKLFQYPKGPDRVATPRYIWSCSSCRAKVQENKVQLLWP